MPDRDDEPQLLITVTRSGGFGGIRRAWTVTLDGAEAEQARPLLEQAVPETDARLPAPGARRGGMPDRFVWTIVVRDGSDERTLRCSEADLSDAARDVIARVKAAPGSRTRPR